MHQEVELVPYSYLVDIEWGLMVFDTSMMIQKFAVLNNESDGSFSFCYEIKLFSFLAKINTPRTLLWLPAYFGNTECACWLSFIK